MNEVAHIYSRRRTTDHDEKFFQIHIGRPTETFCVPEDLICDRSQFFEKLRVKKNAARGNARNIKSMGDCAVNLTDYKTDIFQFYMQWLRTGAIDYETEGPNGALSPLGFIPLARAYVLGVKLEDFGFRNIVLDAMIKVSEFTLSNGTRYGPGAQVLRIIYGGTTQRHSPARRLIVDLYWRKTKLRFIECMETADFPIQFMRELTVAMIEKLSEERLDAPWPDPEAYHEHADSPSEDLAIASPTIPQKFDWQEPVTSPTTMERVSRIIMN